MSSELCVNDVCIAQWCPERVYFDLLCSTLIQRGVPGSELEPYNFKGRHATRATSSEFPLSDEARKLYQVATGSTLVTWSEAVRWVEEQGRHEESVVFNQLYTFAWVRPETVGKKPGTANDRFTPKTRQMEARNNLYDLAHVAQLLNPIRHVHPTTE